MGRFLAYAFVVLAAAFFVQFHAAEEAQTNYENQLSACEAGNPVREAVILATDTAATLAAKGNAQYREAARKIRVAPFVNNSGARDCDKAVIKP